MSKLARTLILGVVLAAMNLASMTAVAQAHTSGDPASQRHRALGQVEFLAAADHAVAAQRQPTNAVELYRRGERALQEQNTADDTTQREWTWMQARQRADTATQTPAPVQPDEPSDQSGWLVVTLGVLAAVLAFVAGLAVLAARRANRRARVGQAT
jgi:hypothetical protein